MIPASTFPAPRDHPLSYPGLRPEYSFVLADDVVYKWRLSKEGAGVEDRVMGGQVLLGPDGALDVHSFLKEKGVSPLHRRFAVLGYGSNPVPGQLVSKLGRDAVVPVALGKLKDTDVVYNLISNRGYAFAELVVNQVGTSCNVGVTFLDRTQLDRMVETEQNYRLVHAPADVLLESGQFLPAGVGSGLYVFAGFRRVWVPKTRKDPVSVAGLLSDDRENQGLSQRQVLELVIHEFGLGKVGVNQPEELANRIRSEANLPEGPPKLKFLLQDRVNQDPRSLPSMVDQLTPVGPREELISCRTKSRDGGAPGRQVTGLESVPEHKHRVPVVVRHDQET